MLRMWCVIACFAALGVVNPAAAADAAGTWLNDDAFAKVRIVSCGDAMCGTVVWLSQPIDAKTGQPHTDKLNPNPKLRSRPIIGVQVFFAMQRKGPDNRWSGHIYDPERGKTYKGTIELLNPTRLKVQGCFWIYCESEIWTRSH